MKYIYSRLLKRPYITCVCLLHLIPDGVFYWIDSGNIKGGALRDGSDYATVYSGVIANHFAVLGNYIYMISSNR